MGHLTGAVLEGAAYPQELTLERSRPINFIDLKAQHARIAADVDERIRDVIASGRYIMGPQVADLEARLAERAGVAHAITVSNGTDALSLALLARGIGAGDAVFLPGFTFTATAEVIVLAGATPIFVDVDPDDFNISPADLEAKIAAVTAQGRLRPAAIIAVDLFGLPADYSRLRPLAARHDIYLIADAAQSFGATRDSQSVGTMADVTTTSFYPSKPLGCYGDGGAVFTDDGALADILRSLRCHGEGSGAYDNVRIGINGRLDTIQAAVLLAKLEIFDAELAARERIARAYDAALCVAVDLPARPAGARSSWAQYTIKVAGRDGLRERLAAQKIPTMVYYPRPMHFQPAYSAYGDGPGSLPVSEALCESVMSLPFHPYLEADEIETVAGAVIAALRG